MCEHSLNLIVKKILSVGQVSTFVKNKKGYPMERV